MPLLRECPDAGVVERFHAGAYTESELEDVAGHIESCPACAGRRFAPDDTFAEALRGGAAVAKTLFNPRVQDLLLHFQEMSPALPFSETAVSDAGDHGSPADHAELSEILAPAQSPGELGRVGTYRVLGVLGRGGMGMVLRAEDTQLHRPLAIKVMLPRLAADRTYRQRFLREARAAAGVKHDHIVTIYQVGEDRGHPFLAMEFLEGESLDALLKRDKVLPTPSILRIGRDIAEGLAAAHARGLIHRDIKPGNVWLEANDERRMMNDERKKSGSDDCRSSFIVHRSSLPRVKILDFGLARIRDDDVRLTQADAIFGTPGYMAPEQAKGLTDEVDARSDLFSLGCVLYQMSTGEPPFKGNSILAVLSALECRDPAPPLQLNPSLPPRLSALIQRLLAKDRTQRPETARAVADELAAIEASFPGSAWERTAREAPPHAREQTGGRASPAVRSQAKPGNEKRRRVPRWAVAACVLLVGGWLMWANFFRPEPGHNDPNADQDIATGKAVSAMALVTDPAPVKGVLSWTLETSGHRGKIRWLGYSPDGKWLASAGQDGTIRLCDPKSGEQKRVFVTGTQVHHPIWSPDSKKLGAQHDGNFWLWDVATGKKEPSPFPNGSLVRNGWLADGRLVVNAQGTVKIVDQNGDVLKAFGPAGAATVTPDGKRLMVRDGTYELTGGYQKVDDIGAGSTWLSFSRDGAEMANTNVPDQGDAVLVRETATGKELLRLKEPPSSFPSPWSRDGKILCLLNPYGRAELQLRDASSGTILVKCEPMDTWGFLYGQDYWTRAQDWSPDGKRLAIGRGDPGVILFFDYDAKAGTCKPSPLNAQQKYSSYLPQYWLTWSADGDTLYVRRDIDPGQSEVAWNLATGKTTELSSPLGGENHYFNNILSPDRRFFADDGGTDLVVRDYATKVEKARFQKLGKTRMKHVAWSPDGTLLGVSGDDNTVRVLDIGMKKVVKERKFDDPCPCLVFSPDGKKLLVTQRFNVQSWEWATGKPEVLGIELNPDDRPLTAMAWSRDGKWLATAHRRQPAIEPGPGDILLWSMGSPKPNPPLKGHYNQERFGWQRTGIVVLEFSPDGKTLASLGDDGVRLWQVEDGKQLGRIIPLGKDSGVAISAAGDYRGHPVHVPGLVYVVQTTAGQQNLTPAEFEQRFRKNDPKKVDLRAK